ncbi:KIAA0141 [Branchiostoma lanceolatum]|uniref:KIAA0141 protein n=1 Tax=Branchiostoma lanceolatum TaxID=7740 RepID=A0A8K0EUX8_BRALA|nr:KIAA0141 [Branchiostoma lanceolatum]
MWRILQGLPRVLRPQISSAAGNHGNRTLSPGLWLEEGEHDGSSAQRSPRVTTVGTRPFVVRLHSEGAGHNHGKNKEKVKQDFWSNFDTKDINSLFDVIGWGSAILLGFQLCRHLSWDVSGEGEGRRLVHTLYKLAFSLPPSHHSVLPSNDRNSLPPSHLSELPSSDNELTEEHTRHRSVAAAAPLPEHRLQHNALLQQALAEFETATKSCSAAIQHAIGLQLAREGDIRHAVDMFRIASAAGSAKAQYNLGVCYEQGRGVDRDLSKAAELYQQSAEQGHGRAQYNLATLYLHGGGGLQQDTHKALGLLQQAAAQGVQQAQSYLGVYWTMEPHRDMFTASQHFASAAQQKHESSQYHLGVCYERGWGVERDLTRAVELYMSAAAAGHTQAAHNLAVLQGGATGDAGFQERSHKMVSALEDKAETSSQVIQLSTQAIDKNVSDSQTSEYTLSATERHTCKKDLKSEESVEAIPCNLSAVSFDDLQEHSNYHDDFGKASHTDLGKDSHYNLGEDSHYDLGDANYSDLGEDSNDDFIKDSHSDLGEPSHHDLGEDSNNVFGTASHGRFHMDRYRARHVGQTTAKPVQLAVS